MSQTMKLRLNHSSGESQDFELAAFRKRRRPKAVVYKC